MSLLTQDINRQYIPSAKTNVTLTLKKLGWTPPSEDIRFQEKWATFRHLAARNEQGGEK